MQDDVSLPKAPQRLSCRCCLPDWSLPGRWLAIPPGKDVSVRGQAEGETART